MGRKLLAVQKKVKAKRPVVSTKTILVILGHVWRLSESRCFLVACIADASSFFSTITDHHDTNKGKEGSVLPVLLFLTDGWSAYPNSTHRAFREKVKQTSTASRK